MEDGSCSLYNKKDLISEDCLFLLCLGVEKFYFLVIFIFKRPNVTYK